MALFEGLKTPEQILSERNAAAVARRRESTRGALNPATAAVGQRVGEELANVFNKFAFGEQADPELQRAEQNAAVLKEIQEEDIDLSTKEGLLSAARKFRDVGNLEQSIQLIDRARSVEIGDLEIENIESQIDARGIPKDARTSLQKNLQAAGFTPGTEEYRAAIKDSLQKKGTTVNITQTEGQRLDEFRASQLTSAVNNMEKVLGAGFDPTTVDKRVVNTFGSWANFLRSPEGQAFEGESDIASAMYINKTSGAAFTEKEKEMADARYKIQPGDTRETIRLKLKRIKELRDTFRDSAGLGPLEVTESTPTGSTGGIKFLGFE